MSGLWIPPSLHLDYNSNLLYRIQVLCVVGSKERHLVKVGFGVKSTISG